LNLDGKQVILYAGSLSLVNHPVDILLEAFGKITQVKPDVALVIVGGGEDYSYLLNLARELGIDQDTHFTGRIDPAEIPYYYGIADVTIDPVKDDDAARGRSPLKLFESWACGVPFLTSPVGDRKYLLGQPPAGLLVEPAGDPEAMAEGMLQVLVPAYCRRTSRLKSRKIAIHGTAWQPNLNEYQKII
jgi:glycosyltransferase involved in cell wall biosynthesis